MQCKGKPTGANYHQDLPFFHLASTALLNSKEQNHYYYSWKGPKFGYFPIHKAKTCTEQNCAEQKSKQ